jgi:hypothetical protein
MHVSAHFSKFRCFQPFLRKCVLKKVRKEKRETAQRRKVLKINEQKGNEMKKVLEGKVRGCA